MSKFYIFDYERSEYVETKNPPNHDHWRYHYQTDSYYEIQPIDVEKDKLK